MRRLIGAVLDELDTLGFILGFGLILWGVSRLSLTGAIILAGVGISVVSILSLRGRS